MKVNFSFLFQILCFLLPWKFRRFLLQKFLGFNMGQNSHIGFSIILARSVKIGNNSYIGHLNLCKAIDEFVIGNNSNIGNINHFTGFSTKDPQVIHFKHIPNRHCSFVLGNESGITSNHYFDCNAGITIGNYCQIAGKETCFMTHSIDFEKNIQDAEPINVGNYVFIGTRCTILKGVNISSKTVIGACSLINKSLDRENTLYAGVPAREKKELVNCAFFSRIKGKV